MEFKIERDSLFAVLQKAQGIVESKGALPILSHVLLTAEKKQICLQATDLEIGIQAKVSAEVVEGGSLTLSARKIHDIVRELPSAVVHLKKEENDWATIRCGKSRFRLPGLPVEDFPKLPDYSDKAELTFTGSQLGEMIRRTFFSISPDETRQALNGLLLEKEGQSVNIVGTDGHRLAFIKRDLPKATDDSSQYLLPKKMLAELLKAVEDPEAEFKFSVKGNQLAFLFDDQVLISRKVDAKFPNYRQVIPKENKLEVRVEKESLVSALKRVALLADEKSKMVRFEIRSGVMTLVTDGTELGIANEELEVKYQGEEMAIGLNARYLLDVMNVLTNDEITLNLKDQNSPCLITVDDDADYLSIVMPMRL